MSLRLREIADLVLRKRLKVSGLMPLIGSGVQFLEVGREHHAVDSEVRGHFDVVEMGPIDSTRRSTVSRNGPGGIFCVCAVACC